MVRQLIYFGLALRLMVTFWNAYFGPSFGASGDAADFHIVAVEFSRELQTDRFVLSLLYSYALGTFYYLTAPSLFLGGALAALTWLLSAKVFVAVMRLLELDRRQQRRAMLIYVLLPSSILWTGVTMREPYQLLFVNLAVYASLRIYLHRASRHWATLLLAVAAGGLLQPALLAYGVVLVAATAVWLVRRSRRGTAVSRLVWVVPVTAVVLVFGFSIFDRVYQFGLGERGLVEAIEAYQRGGLSLEARTHYKESVSIDGWPGFAMFLPVALFQYLFEPMPWRVSSFVDIPPLLENVLRAVLIWWAVKGLFLLPSRRRRPFVLVFLAYFALETTFAVGTVNWGTAARHHLPAIGLLLAAAFMRGQRRRPPIGVPGATMRQSVEAVA
jgi:hypothetical protein